MFHELTRIVAPVLLIAALLLSGCAEQGDPARAQTTADVADDKAQPSDATAEPAELLDTTSEELVVFNVRGMHCNGCANAIQDTVAKLDGVRSCLASFEKGTAQVMTTDPGAGEAAAKAIAGLGYEVERQAEDES